jgi:hypothetical protein
MLVPALASDRNIGVEQIATRCNAFIHGSVPEREDEVRKLQSSDKPNIISAGANDQKSRGHDAQA